MAKSVSWIRPLQEQSDLGIHFLVEHISPYSGVNGFA